MEKRSVGLRGFIYLALVAIAIIASFVYGSLMESNIGSFDEYGPRMPLLPLYAIILIPILITLYFVFLNIASLKLKFTRWKWENTVFILLIIFFTIYMLVLCLTSDISDSINPNFPLKDELPTLDERIWGFFSFYLGLLNIYAFLFLIKPVDGYKTFVTLILLALIMYAVAAIIYSLIVEWDKYVNFKGFEDIYDKPYENYIFSFFAIGNIFGHTLFTAIVALVALAFFYRKYWILLFTLLFLPFVFYSNSRVAMLGTIVLLGGTIIYLYIRSYKYLKPLFYIFTVIFVVGIILLIVDVCFYDFFYFEFGDNKYISLKELLVALINKFKDWRLSIIKMVPVSTTDVLLGVGYGIQFILPRSYSYCYYFHNAFYEVLMVGGLPYFLFLASIFVCAFIKFLGFARNFKNYRPLGFFIILGVTLLLYGLFESYVPFFNNYMGIVLGFLFISVPMLMGETKKNIIFKEEGVLLYKDKNKIAFKVSSILDNNSLNKLIKETGLKEEVLDFIYKIIKNFSLPQDWVIEIDFSKGDSDLNISINNPSLRFDKVKKVARLSF